MSGITTIVISSTAARPPMPLRRATSPSKCVGLTLDGSIDGADSVERARRRNPRGLGQRRAGLLDLDQLGLGVDLGRQVVAALLEREAAELLVVGARVDLDGERLVGTVAGRRLGHDLDLDVVAARLQRHGAVGLDRGVRRGRERGTRGATAAVGTAVVTDPHHPTQVSAVLEEPVDAVGEVRALHERTVVGLVRVAVDLGELGPVRDPHRRVDRAARRQAHECRDRCAHALDRLVRGRNLLDVDAGSQVRGHVTPSLVDVLAAQFASQTLDDRSGDGA